jgi:hypothetical protein
MGTSIRATLALAMVLALSLVIAPAAAARPHPASPGTPPVHRFTVTLDAKVVGFVQVNTASRHYVLDLKGLRPGTYTLSYARTVGGGSIVHAVAAVVANRAGHAHLDGTWRRPASHLAQVPRFSVTRAATPLVAVLEGGYYPGTCSDMNVLPYHCDLTADAIFSSGPIVEYRLDARMSSPDGAVIAWQPLYVGTDRYLGHPRLQVNYGPGYTFQWDLTITDANGNTASDTLVLSYPNPDWQ